MRPTTEQLRKLWHSYLGDSIKLLLLHPGGHGNTMAPGFVPSDVTPGDRTELTNRRPHRAALIAALTREVRPAG